MSNRKSRSKYWWISVGLSVAVLAGYLGLRSPDDKEPAPKVPPRIEVFRLSRTVKSISGAKRTDRCIQYTVVHSSGDADVYADWEPFGSVDEVNVPIWNSDSGRSYRQDHQFVGPDHPCFSLSEPHPPTKRMETTFKALDEFVRSKVDLDTLESFSFTEDFSQITSGKVGSSLGGPGMGNPSPAKKAAACRTVIPLDQDFESCIDRENPPWPIARLEVIGSSVCGVSSVDPRGWETGVEVTYTLKRTNPPRTLPDPAFIARAVADEPPEDLSRVVASRCDSSYITGEHGDEQLKICFHFDTACIADSNLINTKRVFVEVLPVSKDLHAPVVRVPVLPRYRRTKIPFCAVARLDDGELKAALAAADTAATGNVPSLSKLPDAIRTLKSASFSGDGKIVLLAMDKGPIYAWKVDEDRMVRAWPDPLGRPMLSHDGSLLAGVSGQDVLVVDLATGELRHTFSREQPHGYVRAFAFSPDDSRLTIARSAGQGVIGFRVWDTVSCEDMTEDALKTSAIVAQTDCSSHADYAGCIGLSESGDRIAFRVQEDGVGIWDPARATTIFRWPPAGKQRHIPFDNFAVSTDLRWVAHRGETGLSVWDLSVDPTRMAVHDPLVRSSSRLAISPDGTVVACDERRTGHIHLVDTTTGRIFFDCEPLITEDRFYHYAKVLTLANTRMLAVQDAEGRPPSSEHWIQKQAITVWDLDRIRAFAGSRDDR